MQLIAIYLSSLKCMENDNLQFKEWCLGQIFLIVDLRDFFQIKGRGMKKSSEIDQLTGHFQVIFLNVSRKKTLNILSFS